MRVLLCTTDKIGSRIIRAVTWTAKQGGTDLFRPDALRRITPEHLWMLPAP